MAPSIASPEDALVAFGDGEREGNFISSSLNKVARTTQFQLRQLATMGNGDAAHAISRRDSLSAPTYSSIARRSLSEGGIAGVVVGSIVGVCLLCLCFYPWIVRRRRRKQREAQSHQQAQSAGYENHDPEIAQAPSSDATLGHSQDQETGTTAQDPATRQSSKDSFPNKEALYNGASRQSTKDVTSASPTDNGQKNEDFQERGAGPNFEFPRRRSSDEISLGTNPKWHREGPPPISPGGIELVATRADGMEYSEAMAGHSASYYSPTVPSEAFGMATPPQSEEPPQPERDNTARSDSRGSSIKFNLMSLMRRMSSKDAATAKENSISEEPSEPRGTRTLGSPIPVGHSIMYEGFSESPTVQDGPVPRGFGQAPSANQHVPEPMSPAPSSDSKDREEASAERDLSPEDRNQSPPVLPPWAPAPGTVNPMDIMGPSNQSEHAWHTNSELYSLAHPQSSPPRETPATEEPQQEQQEQQQSEQHYQAAEQQSGEAGYTAPDHSAEPAIPPQDIKQECSPDMPQVSQFQQHQQQATPNQSPDQGFKPDPNASNVSFDFNHLAPQQHNRHSSIAESFTDQSDHSMTLPSNDASLPSNRNTPNTLPTDFSPSPRSDGSSDIRNSISPYNGNGGSPQIFPCEQCGRVFDQFHKLNHHRRYHERPHECTYKGCDKRFGTKTHLDRHVNDKHIKTRKFHCLEPTCAYSRAGGKGFPRKDNWRRHMINKHDMNPALDPEPDVVDVTMAGA